MTDIGGGDSRSAQNACQSRKDTERKEGFGTLLVGGNASREAAVVESSENLDGQPLDQVWAALGDDTLDDSVGKQVLCDCWDCQADINSEQVLLEALRDSVRLANVTPLNLFTHKFTPNGISAVAIIAESHIFIHSWPEKRYVALDVFTCGSTAMPERAITAILDAFRPKRYKMVRVIRRAQYHGPR